jgi:hypothetical protein
MNKRKRLIGWDLRVVAGGVVKVDLLTAQSMAMLRLMSRQSVINLVLLTVVNIAIRGLLGDRRFTGDVTVDG